MFFEFRVMIDAVGEWRKPKNAMRPRSRLRRAVYRLWRFALGLARSPVIRVVPLATVLVVECVDFITFDAVRFGSDVMYHQRTTGKVEDESARARAESIQKIFQAFAYGTALILTLPVLRSAASFFYRERAFLVLSAVVLLSVFVSDYPMKVVTNTVHLVLGLLVAYLYVSSVRSRDDVIRSVQWAVVLCTGAIHLISIGYWISLGLASGIGSLTSGLRYGGFAGNPNSMGSVCMLCCWAGFGLMASDAVSRPARVLAGAFCIAAVISAVLADSVTTYVVIAGLACLTSWFYFIGRLAARTQIVVNAVLVSGGILMVPVLLYVQAQGSLLGSASETLTGDESLTGRTEIWETGMAAFVERPLFGWSYDSHQTVFDDSRFTIPYFQYHNGFVDTLVTGGVVLLGLLIWILLLALMRCRVVSKLGMPVSAVLSCTALLLVQNLSEYSIMRPLSPIWHVYTVCAVAVAFLALSNANVPLGGRVQTRKLPTSSRSKKLAYRF